MTIVKCVVAFVAMSIAGALAAQERHHLLPLVDGKIHFSEIVEVDGADKDSLYSRAKLWFASKFASADALTLDDRQNGVLLGRGRVLVKENEVGVRTLISQGQYVEKTWDSVVKIQVKDGRYKVDFYDIVYTFSMPGNTVGHNPLPRNLDQLFADRKMYKRDGTLKRGAPSNISSWTNGVYTSMMSELREAMSVRVILEDF